MERKKGQRYSKEFRRQAVEQMKACNNIARLSRELGICRRFLYNWRDRLDETDPPPLRSRELMFRKQITKLKRLLANKTLEVDFFRQTCLAENRGSAPAEVHLWRRGIHEEIRARMSLQGGLSVERMCRLVPVSRAGFYRYLRRTWPTEEEIDLRSAVQEIVLEHRWQYGYRRVTAELQLRGMVVNRKRIARIMREDNLLAVRREPPASAQRSIRAVRIYLNLASRMKVLGPNQLWIADITYIRLYREFVYLAVVLDGFSRKVIGWSLARTLQAKLPLCALEKAIATRRPPPGVVHHSDQGVQYSCRDYMQKLHEHRMLPSISRPANPFDNATCESFLKTIKREEIHASVYRNLEDLHNKVLDFIEQYYNRCRLHSALGYRSPDEFEREAGESNVEVAYAAPIITFWGT